MLVFVGLFLTIFTLNSLSNDIIDTIFVEQLPRIIKEELNVYNLKIQTRKNKLSHYYLGLDWESIYKAYNLKSNQKLVLTFVNLVDSVEFCFSAGSDTNFIFFFKKIKYQWQDTLRFSEEKKTKKIDFGKVYQGYKHLNPIKITITNISNENWKQSYEKNIAVFCGKRFLFFIPSIEKFYIQKSTLSNKNDEK
ncbi:MAG: hypothetical protein N2517_04380 [Ignavibacteria bacterium]|nr:hypothetical protein [Ignavibacteria bacterium]